MQNYIFFPIHQVYLIFLNVKEEENVLFLDYSQSFDFSYYLYRVNEKMDTEESQYTWLWGAESE